MKKENREVYTTDDGKEFYDLVTATTHEAALENEVEVDDFIASLGEDVAERAKSRIRNDIMKFLGFRAMQADATTKKAKATT